MKIYIAGPYTKGDVAFNVREAILAADALRAMGHTPYLPHLTHFWHMIVPHEINYWYKLDLEWLEQCDAVFRIPGESTGADVEVRRSLELNMPVYSYMNEVPKAE